MSDISSLPSPEKPSPIAGRLGYLPALDGLRALAVLAVLFYHADVLWLPGGFLGVEIFFVVSGYLITSLLLAEYRSRRSINLKQFWQRRARRLLPALFAMIAAVLIYAVLFLPEEVASLRGDVLAAFTYVTNWYLIYAEKSYFETIGRPSLLRHLWSLAVEEQFYLLWPLLFVLVLGRCKSRVAMLLLMLGATASALWMGIQFNPDADPSRIYYGTDTRAAGLLIGGALAFVRLPRANAGWLAPLLRGFFDVIGFAALGALVAACLHWTEFDPFLYQGGILLVAAATALVIAAVVSPGSPVLGSLLGTGILRWIGLRSYSLYLWHWPVFMVTRPQLDTTLEGAPLLLLRFTITFALAEISYRLIESPIRHGALGSAWRAWNDARDARRWGLSFAWVGVVGCIVIGAYFLGNAVLNAAPPPPADYMMLTEEDAENSYNETPPTALEVSAPETASQEPAGSSDLSPVSFVLEPEPLPASTEATTELENWLRLKLEERATWTNSFETEIFETRIQNLNNHAVVTQIPEPCNAKCQSQDNFEDTAEGLIRSPKIPTLPLARKSVVPANEQGEIKESVMRSAKPIVHSDPAPLTTQVLAIGDSVMLGASPYLRRNFLAIDVDAKLGRQVSAALRLVRARLNAKALAPVVVIHLGNNGTFSPGQFDEMMTLLHDVHRVVFLTNKVPRKWQEPNNSALQEGVKRYSNALLIDWNGTSVSHPEWFWQDGIHLRPEGAKVYANLIAGVVAQSSQ